MILPIDVVPNTRPPRFRWRQRVKTLAGDKVVENEGALPAWVEGAVAELVALAKGLKKRLESAYEVSADTGKLANKLQAFKDWVHAYLDAQGVPKEFPDGPHTREGCRIGDRMDWLVAELKRSASSPKRGRG